MGSGSTSVIQVTNIAPTVTNEQLRTLLAFVGTIREFTVYPSNDPAQQMARVCYVKYLDPMSVCVAQHLTNTVFIDRAIFVKPISDGKIPDEVLALKLANEGHSQNSSNSGVVSQVANVNGTQSITTIDPRLNALGLPQYPPLPANLDPSKIEEIRRTVSVSNVSQYTTPESILEFFNQFGEVKYLRMTSSEGDIIKSALIEFTDQSSVANALQNTGTTLNGLQLSINHSNTSILKPQHNPADGEKFYESREVKGRSKDSRSPVHSRRGRSPSRRSRSPHRSRSDRRRSGSRSRSHERRRRSRSRERRRSPERRRSRSRSYSKERNRERSRRGRSKDRDRHQSSKNRSIERDRSRKNLHHDRRREHSNEHRSKDRDRERSSRTRDHRSRDSERKDRHRSKRDKERRRSRSRSKSKNVPNKKENSVLPLEIIKAEEMDISEDKNEPDNYSVKSEEGSSSMKSSSSRRSSSQSRSHGKIDKKREKLYDSEEEFSLKF